MTGADRQQSDDLVRLALAAGNAYAERSTIATFLDERDQIIYHLLREGALALAESGESAIFTREWVDDIWRNRRSVRYATAPDDPFPGSVES